MGGQELGTTWTTSVTKARDILRKRLRGLQHHLSQQRPSSLTVAIMQQPCWLRPDLGSNFGSWGMQHTHQRFFRLMLDHILDKKMPPRTLSTAKQGLASASQTSAREI